MRITLKKLAVFLLASFVFSAPLISVHVNADAVQTSAKSAFLCERGSGRVIYSKNADQRMPMASTTKIMTALTALSAADPDSVATVSKNAEGTEGSSMYLRAGEKVTLRELLYGLMLSSGNDAAVAVAEHVSGSTAAFADLMNRKAAELGLTNTHFENPNGLDSAGHYTTAAELAKIMDAALSNELFREITSCKSKKTERAVYTNHNKLLFMYDGVYSGKTGFTKKDGRCLVSACERNGFSLIAVTLSDPDDWNDHMKMYDAAFAEYKFYTAAEKDGGCGEVRTDGAEKVPLIFGNAMSMYVRDGKAEKPEIRYNLPEVMPLPVHRGDVVGTAELWLGNTKYAECSVLSGADLEKSEPGFLDISAKTVKMWLEAFR